MGSFTMTISAQNIITAASLMAAIIAIAGYVFKARDWVKHQNEQDGRLKKLEDRHQQDIKDVREECQLIIYGVLACLKGLKEQGCNGPVSEAINKFEKHLNQKAHER